jgi:hypothetical protein
MIEFIMSIVLLLFIKKCLKMAIEQGNTGKRYIVAKRISEICILAIIVCFILSYY